MKIELVHWGHHDRLERFGPVFQAQHGLPLHMPWGAEPPRSLHAFRKGQPVYGYVQNLFTRLPQDCRIGALLHPVPPFAEVRALAHEVAAEAKSGLLQAATMLDAPKVVLVDNFEGPGTSIDPALTMTSEFAAEMIADAISPPEWARSNYNSDADCWDGLRYSWGLDVRWRHWLNTLWCVNTFEPFHKSLTLALRGYQWGRAVEVQLYNAFSYTQAHKGGAKTWASSEAGATPDGYTVLPDVYYYPQDHLRRWPNFATRNPDMDLLHALAMAEEARQTHRVAPIFWDGGRKGRKHLNKEEYAGSVAAGAFLMGKAWLYRNHADVAKGDDLAYDLAAIEAVRALDAVPDLQRFTPEDSELVDNPELTHAQQDTFGHRIVMPFVNVWDGLLPRLDYFPGLGVSASPRVGNGSTPENRPYGVAKVVGLVRKLKGREAYWIFLRAFHDARVAVSVPGLPLTQRVDLKRGETLHFIYRKKGGTWYADAAADWLSDWAGDVPGPDLGDVFPGGESSTGSNVEKPVDEHALAEANAIIIKLEVEISKLEAEVSLLRRNLCDESDARQADAEFFAEDIAKIQQALDEERTTMSEYKNAYFKLRERIRELLDNG